MKGFLESKWMVWAALALAALAGVAAVQPGRESGGASAEERRVADVLSAIAGAGRVEVALFYGASAPALSGAEGKQITGAVVVAEGAEDMEVRLALTRAVRTLLALPEAAVDVFVMEDSG